LHKFLSNDFGKVSRDKTKIFLSNINEIILIKVMNLEMKI
jgi:hypothetical protein